MTGPQSVYLAFVLGILALILFSDWRQRCHNRRHK